MRPRIFIRLTTVFHSTKSEMKFDLVLINFPFDDFKTLKVRPALCITERISVHNHVVLAAVTSNLNNATEKTDLIINCEDDDFKKQGSKLHQ